jgi:hypothetical protein
MKRTLMVSVAALALAAGSTIAMSQGNSGRGEGGASGGASGQMNESPAPGRGAQDRAIPDKQQKAQQAPSGTQAPTTKQSQGERDKSGTQQQTQSPSAGGSKQGTAGTAGTMKSSNVSLTTEQKTVIRSKVLTSSAPRVTNVNFDIRVGTVVPRAVRIAPVPVTLIEIEPTWRGYMYFVYADEIIIVEPRTLQIVAVLQV